MKIRIFCFLTLLSTLTYSAIPLLPAPVKKFIHDLALHDHFKQTTLIALFKPLHKDKSIVKQMNAPYEKETWERYRAAFVTHERVQLGVHYWKAHKTLLQQAEKKYGVPASIIVAIIGVESEYGLHEGTHPVLNTLYTLAFYYPKRETFFKKELREYLLLTRANHLNATKLKGSYAGAVGIAQFMPSSYRSYGISPKPHSPVDLFDKHDDAIMSVANFLAENGWKAKQPIAKKLDANHVDEDDKHIVAFKGEKKVQAWRIYDNFNVILHYNHSPSYAMVVYQLAKEIQRHHA